MAARESGSIRKIEFFFLILVGSLFVLNYWMQENGGVVIFIQRHGAMSEATATAFFRAFFISFYASLLSLYCIFSPADDSMSPATFLLIWTGLVALVWIQGSPSLHGLTSNAIFPLFALGGLIVGGIGGWIVAVARNAVIRKIRRASDSPVLP